MLETCDGISPNIRLCYIILKFIRNHFFPHFVEDTENYLTGKPIYYPKSMYSSHLLKQILFREVIKFPSHEQWKNSSIIIRITSMLKILSERSSIVNVYNNEDILLKYNILFLPILGDMIKWLQNGCKRSLLLRKNTQSDFDKKAKVLLNERMLVNLPKSLLNKCLQCYWGSMLMHNVEISYLNHFHQCFSKVVFQVGFLRLLLTVVKKWKR